MPMPKCKKICKVLYMKITTFYIIHNYYIQNIISCQIEYS